VPEPARGSLVGDGYPLDAGQRWLSAAAAHDPVMARPVQRVYRLRPGVRSGDLLAAARYVVSFHPALRMRLVENSRRPSQRFDDQGVRIEGVSVQGRTAARRAAYAEHLFQEQAYRPLDLHREAPLHLLAIEVDGEYFLGVAMDHRAADEAAMDIFEQDLDAAWAREAAGLPHPPIGTSAYPTALEQGARPDEEAGNLQWWLTELRGSPLATGQRGGWTPGSTASLTIAGPELDRIVSTCRNRRVPLSAAVVAAQLAWWRLRAVSRDLVLNVPVSNRVRPVEHTWIANRSMLLHPRFRPSVDERDLVDVRDVLLEAMRHRQYDYGSLSAAVSADAAARGGSFSWLTGVSYVVPRQASPIGGRLLAERLDGQNGARAAVPTGSFSLSARHDDAGLTLRADWDHTAWGSGPDTFTDELVELLAWVVR
jgi:hypothetical protein